MVSEQASAQMQQYIKEKIMPALTGMLPAGQAFGLDLNGWLGDLKYCPSDQCPKQSAFRALMWLVYAQRFNAHVLTPADASYLVLTENENSHRSILFVKVAIEIIEKRQRIVMELAEATIKAIGEYCGPKKMGFRIPDLVEYCQRKFTSDTQMISRVAKASFREMLYTLEHLMIRKVPIDVKGVTHFVELLFHEGWPITDFHLRQALLTEWHGE